MYTMVDIIYGVPITMEVASKIYEMEGDENSNWFEDENGPCGFTTVYSGVGSYLPGYCGVSLASCDAIEPFKLNLYEITPDEEQVKLVKEKVDALMPELKELIKPIGLYIIWSTS